MNGLKMILVGIAVILIASFFMIDPNSGLGGYGELICYIIGLNLCIKGLKRQD